MKYWIRSDYIDPSILERYPEEKLLSWKEYVDYVKLLDERLRRSQSMGGFDFDIIVGINKGGLITADLLARIYGQDKKQVIPIYSFRGDGDADFESDKMNILNEGDYFVLKAPALLRKSTSGTRFSTI